MLKKNTLVVPAPARNTPLVSHSLEPLPLPSRSHERKEESISSPPPPAKAPKNSRLESRTRNALVKAHCQDLVNLCVKEESKEVIPLYKGTDQPQSLRPPHLGYDLVDTKESQLLRSVLVRMFSQHDYSFRLTTALNMSSSGTGIINSVITNSSLASVSEFSSLSTLFNEFFVESIDATWEPVSMYNYPLTGVVATSVSSLPLGVASLQGSQSAYTSLTAMTDNGSFAYHNTGRPFSHHWKNVNKRTIADQAPYSVGTATQAWCPCINVASYVGQIQYLTQSAPPALPVSQVIGTHLVEWLVYFRVRT